MMKIKNTMNSLCRWPSSLSSKILLFFSLLLCTTNAAFNVSTISFDQGYLPLFGDGNLVRSPDSRSVRLLLDRFTGSGFISSKMYKYGFFSASIKLPDAYTAGVCVAFYTSNGDVFRKNHDELDFEFLGNVEGKPWRFQTNLYGNGSTFRGREERYELWFDPTKDFHRYSILWTPKNIIFFIDEVPIREVVRAEEMNGEYPSKPMALYATIWDASTWATSGGRYKVNYQYAPFVAEFKDLILEGCSVDPVEQITAAESCSELNTRLATADYAVITKKQRTAMRRFRQRFMHYSYCYDTLRYNVALPECVVDPYEKELFMETGRLKIGGRHRGGERRSRRHGL